jgi:hypothetical protein
VEIHDQHFLVRLERLGRQHVELALGLYHDRQLVEHVLGVADIPHDAERVALCLGEAGVGPHLIVARDGHFVTCLAEGMHLREGQPVISRHRLDKISESVESLRSLVADSASGSRRTWRRVERLFEVGSRLTREEFDDVARWLPLLETDFLFLHMESVEKCLELVDQLARIKHWNQRNESMLHMYWRLNWAIAHLTMLLGSDDECLRILAERLEATMPGASMQFAWTLLRLGVMPFALRGVWAASKIPAFIVPTAKRRYLDPDATFLSTMSDGLSLSAAALRHRRYQGEVRKVLERGRPNPDEDDLSIPEVMVRGYCSAFFETLVHEPQTCLDYILQQSRHLVENGLIGPPEHAAAIAGLPDDSAIALFAQELAPISEQMTIRALFAWLAWVVDADARAFYLPAEHAALTCMPWQRKDGLALLVSRVRLGVAPRPRPITAPPKIGRNDPCPCGSGNKYKRCCGAPGKP